MILFCLFNLLLALRVTVILLLTYDLKWKEKTEEEVEMGLGK